MPCIVSGALILFTDPKGKRLHEHMQFLGIRLSKVHKETQKLHFFEFKWLNYICKKLGTFSLFALCSSDNLVHILFQLVETFSCTLYNSQELKGLY